MKPTSAKKARRRFAAGFVLTASIAAASAGYADTVKVGIIGPMSGNDAYSGRAWKQTIDIFQKVRGDMVDGNKVEFIYRDLPEFDPAKAKTLAQELIIKEHVQYLAGIFYTPEALAIAPIAEETQTPTVIFNAATPAILEKSQYMLRVSYTLPQMAAPVAKYALEQGAKTGVTMVADYVSGLTTEAAFTAAFDAGGGKVVDKIHVPLRSADFGPFMQRIRADKPDVMFVFLPSVPDYVNLINAFKQNGLDADHIRFLGTGETDELGLPQIGDAALGLVTGFFYSPAHSSEENAKFAKMLTDADPSIIVDESNLVAYDGAALIYKMVAATGGQRDGAKALAAVKGFEWESPRGPVKIDPVSRQLIQNVYMRKVERGADGKLVNREFFTYPMQPAVVPLATP
jgi:branched-chain amino acid transport system substrate-binding protein